jgi:hypothetical protein
MEIRRYVFGQERHVVCPQGNQHITPQTLYEQLNNATRFIEQIFQGLQTNNSLLINYLPSSLSLLLPTATSSRNSHQKLLV